MAKKNNTLANAILLSIEIAGAMLAPFVDGRYKSSKGRSRPKNYNSYRNSLYHLRRRGLIEVSVKEGQKFLKLTKKGQLETLITKAMMPQVGKWDRKWRLAAFDIPEGAKDKRNLLRRLLKRNGFKKLQASLYANPYPLSRSAVVFLKQSGLIRYIRLIKVEEMDDDQDLRKYFKL